MTIKEIEEEKRNTINRLKKEIVKLKKYNKQEFEQKKYWYSKYNMLVSRLRMCLDLSGDLK